MSEGYERMLAIAAELEVPLPILMTVPDWAYPSLNAAVERVKYQAAAPGKKIRQGDRKAELRRRGR